MEYQDVTTGSDGTAVIKNMDAGWVTVVEQKAKDGYILDQTPHHIQLIPGEDAQIIIKNKHGQCFPAISTIAADLKLSKRTVERALADLEKGEFISREHRWRSKGGKSSNLYRLLDDP